MSDSENSTAILTEESHADVKNENASPPVKQSTNGVHEKKEPASSPVNGEHESSPEQSDHSDEEASPSKLDTSANEEEKETSDADKDEIKEEESEEEEEDGENSKSVEEAEKLKPGLLEQPTIIEGGRKRERRKTEHLKIEEPTPSKDKTLEIKDGAGVKLGDLPRVELQLGRKKSEELRALHRYLFGQADKVFKLKKNIRAFSGYTFEKDSVEYKKKVTSLNKVMKVVVHDFCVTLDVPSTGSKEAMVDRLMEFLMEPKSSGKALPTKKKGRGPAKGKKRKTKGSSKDGKKAKRQKKSSSTSSKKDSDDDDESDDEQEESSEQEQSDSEKDDDSGSDYEESKPKKKKKASAKKTPKKKPAPKKKAPKAPAKKVESSSESDGSLSSDDDDEPLVKKTDGPPSDAELRFAVKKLLKKANLEEVTMKSVCKDIYNEYPDYDLTDRKSFIKEAVKEIIK